MEVQLRVDALRPHIHGQRDHVHVAGALAVAEEGGLHAVRPGQQAQLGGGHAGAPVVVGVEGDDGPLPAGELADEVLQHVGELVGHTVFHGGGQVEDNGLVRGGVEVVQHGGADLHGVVHLRAHEGLGGVLVPQVHALGDDGLGHLVDEVGGIGGDLGDAVGVHVEHHLALEGGGGVVEVENDVLCPLDGLEGAADKVLAGLNQHLNGHVVGDVAALDELTADLEFRLAGGGEADLDLLHTDVDEGVEIFQLVLKVHGVHQRLIAVPQVHGAPRGGVGDHMVGPCAVLDGLGLEGNVLLITGFHENAPPLSGRGKRKRPRQNCQGRNRLTRYHPCSAFGCPNALAGL